MALEWETTNEFPSFIFDLFPSPLPVTLQTRHVRLESFNSTCKTVVCSSDSLRGLQTKLKGQHWSSKAFEKVTTGSFLPKKNMCTCMRGNATKQAIFQVIETYLPWELLNGGGYISTNTISVAECSNRCYNFAERIDWIYVTLPQRAGPVEDIGHIACGSSGNKQFIVYMH